MKKISLLVSLLLSAALILFGCSENNGQPVENVKEEQQDTEKDDSTLEKEAENALIDFLTVMVNENYEAMIPYFAQENMDKSGLSAEEIINAFQAADEEGDFDRVKYTLHTFEKIDENRYQASYTIDGVIAGEEEHSYNESVIVQLEEGEWKINFIMDDSGEE